MSTLIEICIVVVLILVIVLLVMEYVKRLVNMQAGRLGKEEESPIKKPVPEVPEGRSLIGAARSPFRQVSYRNSISSPITDEEETFEVDPELSEIAHYNDRSPLPDDDDPFVQNNRDYVVFRQSLDRGKVDPEDKRLVRSEIDKVLKTEFAEHYAVKLEQLMTQLAGLDAPKEKNKPSNDPQTESSPEGGRFNVEMPKAI